MSAYDFKECDTCAPKPGSPTLCNGCLANRAAMGRMQRDTRHAESEAKNAAYQAECWKTIATKLFQLGEHGE